MTVINYFGQVEELPFEDAIHLIEMEAAELLDDGDCIIDFMMLNNAQSKH